MVKLYNHVMGFLIILASLGYYGWAPHPSEQFAIAAMIIGGFSFMNAQQLALLEQVLGKSPLTNNGSGGSSSSAQSAVSSSNIMPENSSKSSSLNISQVG
jgi:hypothetical protein